MKGTTIIELTDAKTGKVEKTVDHNYFTNALKYYFGNGSELSPSPFGCGAGGDWIYNLLGGVMLFDETMETSGVEDDPEIIEPQLGIGMTANAVRGVLNSGDPVELGSWNETESGWQADGTYRMVFDWTTSQGNGTIKSVCLAPRFFAYEGIGNKSESYQQPSSSMPAGHYSNSRSRSETGFPVALYNNCMWTMSNGTIVEYWPQESYINISNIEKLTFHQYSLAITEADLRSTPSAGKQYDDVEITLPSALQNTTMYIRRWQQRGNHLYLLCANGTAYTDTFYILDINLQTKAVANTYTVVPSTYGSTASNDRMMAITDKHFLYNDVCIDYTANTSVAVTYSTANPRCAVTIGDRFYTTFSTANLYLLDCIDPSTGAGYPVNRMGADLDYESKNYSNMLLWNIGYGEKLMLYVYYNWTCYRNPRFLSTINNLSQTVTKTADKTMKVTYVIDFDVE